VLRALLTVLAVIAVITGCSPEVGTERWCNKMDKKPKGDWTLEETRDYARYCVLGTEKEE